MEKEFLENYNKFNKFYNEFYEDFAPYGYYFFDDVLTIADDIMFQKVKNIVNGIGEEKDISNCLSWLKVTNQYLESNWENILLKNKQLEEEKKFSIEYKTIKLMLYGIKLKQDVDLEQLIRIVYKYFTKVPYKIVKFNAKEYNINCKSRRQTRKELASVMVNSLTEKELNTIFENIKYGNKHFINLVNRAR